MTPEYLVSDNYWRSSGLAMIPGKSLGKVLMWVTSTGRILDFNPGSFFFFLRLKTNI